MIWAWLIAVGSAAPCEHPATLADLSQTATAAEQALEDLDEDAFRVDIAELSGLVLPCLAGPIDAPHAARVHRLLALHLYGLDEQDGALAALHAARVLAPEASIGEALAPANHPLQEAWPMLDTARKTGRVPEPRDGFLSFDGVPGRDRPLDTPSVVQQFDSTGQPLWTAYLDPTAHLEPYPAIPHQRKHLLACAAIVGPSAIGLNVGSVLTKQRLRQQAGFPNTPVDTLDGLRRRANGLASVATLGGFTALSCGVAALLVGER